VKSERVKEGSARDASRVDVGMVVCSFRVENEKARRWAGLFSIVNTIIADSLNQIPIILENFSLCFVASGRFSTGLALDRFP
jgi:hypothetical protein